VLLFAQSSAHAKSIERHLKAWISRHPPRPDCRAFSRKNFGNTRRRAAEDQSAVELEKSDVQKYMEEHHLPVHPLYEKGYRSVGCAPCTIAIGVNDDERAGRWAGRGKVECGLHTDMFQKKENDRSAERIFFRRNEGRVIIGREHSRRKAEQLIIGC
jgi:hypothetical protein